MLGPRHGRLNLPSISTLVCHQHLFDLFIGPAADPACLAGRDVCGSDATERPSKFSATFAERALVVGRAIDSTGMAVHAMRESGEIKATLDGILEVGVADRFLCAGDKSHVCCPFIDRRLYLVAHRRRRAKKGDNGIEVAWRHDLVEYVRHGWRQRYAVWADAVS